MIRELVKRAKELYPQSRRMRHDWVRKTYQLKQRGRHAETTGGWVNGGK